MKITLLVGGGGDTYYELGLLSGLVSEGVHVDFIGSDAMKDAEILKNENVSFFNLRGSQDPCAPLRAKIFRVLSYYFRLMKYAAKTDSKLFHIQWPNKFVHFDRIFLNTYYKMLGKKLVFTAHNVNAGVRDGNDSFVNRVSLKVMYEIVDHIIVHTNKMKDQLVKEFGIRENKVTVIPYGINNAVFKSELTSTEARRKLHLDDEHKVLLFFGVITPYKGLEYLLSALANQKIKDDAFRLVIAGKIDKNCGKYWEDIQEKIDQQNLRHFIIEKIAFVPNEDIEVYFKAADVLILPYRYIFQSGILFLAFNFGLPVIATDVGSLRDYVIEGRAGFICAPENPDDLAGKIDMYFKSDLFKNLEASRKQIIGYANEEYSWEKIGRRTCEIYRSFL